MHLCDRYLISCFVPRIEFNFHNRHPGRQVALLPSYRQDKELEAQTAVTCPVSPARQQQAPSSQTLSLPCASFLSINGSVQSDQWGEPSENAGRARQPRGWWGLEQGGLTIEQPSDSGHWGPQHRALQHKVLALRDSAVLQDTGERGGHLRPGQTCEGEEQMGHLKSLLACCGVLAGHPKLCKDASLPPTPRACPRPGFALPIFTLGSRQRHQRRALGPEAE